MSSMTPSHAPTEILMVDLANIRKDPSWPTDPLLVTSFRASIQRGEPPLLDLSLNRIQLADGTTELEVIDGMHRLEALRLEGVAQHSAKVREYSLQDAFYARIATSLGKPNELFRQRAERALREGFIQDVAAHLEGATVYQRGLGEDGTIQPTLVVNRYLPTRCSPSARFCGCTLRQNLRSPKIGNGMLSPGSMTLPADSARPQPGYGMRSSILLRCWERNSPESRRQNARACSLPFLMTAFYGWYWPDLN